MKKPALSLIVAVALVGGGYYLGVKNAGPAKASVSTEAPLAAQKSAEQTKGGSPEVSFTIVASSPAP